MRVIDARTQQLIDLPPGEKYAILSHTWEAEEITFQDMSIPTVARRKRGFRKIEGLCKKALQDGYSFCWSDTCCINKESSAELGEAINSMYKWYQDADVCYALLTDVEIQSPSIDVIEGQLKKAKWFTRGWTLQELLAPKIVILFDKNWNMLGTKASMTEFLADVTRIDGAILSGEAPLSKRSVAQRMSWAAGRITTRVEDIAYCLLGIFDVNMPMIYGEGDKAFIRLQLQIIEQSDDHSIFAWPIRGTGKQGMLADSPTAFRYSHGVYSFPSRRGRSPYRVSNRGLSLKLPATPFATDTYLVQLDCYGLLDDSSRPAEAGSVALGFFLRRLGEDDQYARVECNGLTFRTVSVGTERTKIKFNVRQRVLTTSSGRQQKSLNGFYVNGQDSIVSPSKAAELLFPPNMFKWNEFARTITAEAREGFGDVGYLDVKIGRIRVLKLGFDGEFNPVCFLAAKGGLREGEAGGVNWTGSSTRSHYNITEKIRPTEDGELQRLSIIDRHASDTHGWSPRRNGRAIELEFHRGLWAVRGDRLQGVDIILDNSAPMFSQQLVRLVIKRDAPEDGYQWRVRLEYSE